MGEHWGIGGVRFLPVRVVRQETGEELQGYSVMHVLRVVSAFDPAHSRYKEMNSRYLDMRYNIFVLALLRAPLAGEDVFRLAERKVSTFVSRRVVERLEAMGATGFRWIPVPCY